MTKRFGFTLAEVLITLGLIGVVAAMTIPNLIANTNGAKFRSQFKKSISTLSQAGLMSQAQYDFDYAGTTEACGDATDHPEETMTMCAVLNGTLTGQTYVANPFGENGLKRNSNGTQVPYALEQVYTIDDSADYHAYTLADGSIVAFKADAVGCELPIGTQLTGEVLQAAGEGEGAAPAGGLNGCLGFIDVNGVTLPNKEVSCAGEDGANEASLDVQTPCAVSNKARYMTDIFPIVFHDAVVEPASDAAKYVLTSSK